MKRDIFGLLDCHFPIPYVVKFHSLSFQLIHQYRMLYRFYNDVSPSGTQLPLVFKVVRHQEMRQTIMQRCGYFVCLFVFCFYLVKYFKIKYFKG